MLTPSLVWNSKDIAGCQEAAFVALYTAFMQCCCNGGICYGYISSTDDLVTWIGKFYLMFWNFLLLFYQALPIFLDGLVTAWGAILISVTLILLFGEVRIHLWLFVLRGFWIQLTSRLPCSTINMTFCNRTHLMCVTRILFAKFQQFVLRIVFQWF